MCITLTAFAYFAYMFPFYVFDTNNFTTSLEKLTSIEYLKTLVPLLIIIALSAVGIVLCVWLRDLMIKTDKRYSRFADVRTSRTSNAVMSSDKSKAWRKSPAGAHPPVAFMIVSWLVMIVFSFMMIWGGLIFGLHMSSISIPILSCPWNTEQMTESSCYYLSHLNELFELPIKSILIFMASTVGFTLILGRAICGFLCPMGLIQDIMDKIRQKTKIEGIAMNEKMYNALTPVKWCMVLIFVGLCFAGGNFCNFCPAVAVSPILAGISSSLYVSGFMMILVLMGGFFKRRLFCTVCPLGYLMGLLHKISLFRIKKDCQSCTECGACYEACPMGIKMIEQLYRSALRADGKSRRRYGQ